MISQTKPLRIVFMGTPDFAAIVLQKIIAWGKADIIASYCQPDRPAGRGYKVQSSAVKIFSNTLGIPVHQPRNFKSEHEVEKLHRLKPDLLIVAAYGLILPQSVLGIPKIFSLNVHASLLPYYRGAAPIQRAIMANDSFTGVTIIRMEKGLDTGPMFTHERIPITITDTAATMHYKLAQLGGKVLIKVLEQIVQGTLSEPIPQDDTQATYAPKLTKSDGYIWWDMLAEHVHAVIRGVTPWPGAQTSFKLSNHNAINILFQPGEIGNSELLGYNSVPYASPGSILGLNSNAIAIACKDVPYLIYTLRPEGRKTMSAKDFWNGYVNTSLT